jgi:hypothetical protein
MSNEIPPEAFSEIINELQRRPLYVNQYRKVSGSGRSQCFGLVNRRCMPPDHSRNNWTRPYLYKLLIEFGEKYVSIPWTSITVNQNYQANKHLDRGNIGDSFLVAFGNYTGGELVLYEGEEKQLIDICNKPVVNNFSKVWHSVEPFSGNRFSLVYYTLNPKGLDISQVPKGSVIFESGKWLFKRGDEIIREGLDHPLRGRKHTKKQEDTPQLLIERKEIIIDLN